MNAMKLYIIAGEASGDLHGSNLMKGLYNQNPNIQLRFWGGEMMNEVFLDHCDRYGRQPDCGLVTDYKDNAVMGFWEVFKKAGALLSSVKKCQQDIMAWKPDAVVLIDYPGFNFKIAEFAHKAGFKVFYYIAPKVWASREGRIRKLKKYVDMLFIIFPFEVPYFTRKALPFVYKGNPLVDAIDGRKLTREEFFKRNNLIDKPYVALLAGSRNVEISHMMPVLTAFVRKMRAIPEYSAYQYIIAGAPSRSQNDYCSYLSEDDNDIKLVFGQTQDVVKFAEAAIINSGTASLEAVLLGTPQVVGYISSDLTIAIAKMLAKGKIKYISLGNLIIDRLAFRELIQDDCSAEALVAEVRRLVEDEEYRGKMLQDYACIRQLLGGNGASDAVASEMLRLLSI